MATAKLELFVDNLTTLDCSYLDTTSGIVGETYIVDLILEGTQDETGMMIDFGVVKKRVKELLDTEVDHTLLVPAQSDALTHAHDSSLEFHFAGGMMRYKAPREASTFLASTEVTLDAVECHINTLLPRVLPETVRKAQAHLRHETIHGPYYRYSHALKKHTGDCQRIAHGHRSKIEVSLNGEPAPTLAAEVARQFRDIYVGTEEDVVETIKLQGVDYLTFRYTGTQGEYELSYPRSRCVLLKNDSTVENIAQYLAQKLGETHIHSEVRVRAFEGVDKGAAAYHRCP